MSCLISFPFLVASIYISRAMFKEHTYISKLATSGTNYCGSGTMARNFDDLGRKADVDSCCRTHDFCKDYIMGKETKYNLTNDSAYVR